MGISTGLRAVDIYRRVPRDLTEASPFGGLLSALAVLVSALLFVEELRCARRPSRRSIVALFARLSWRSGRLLRGAQRRRDTRNAAKTAPEITSSGVGALPCACGM